MPTTLTLAVREVQEAERQASLLIEAKLRDARLVHERSSHYNSFVIWTEFGDFAVTVKALPTNRGAA